MAELEKLNNLRLYSLYELHLENVLSEEIEKENNQVSYYINSYQRGYRWDDKQIELLLKDLWEFHQKGLHNTLKSQEYYCLQPIVVKSVTKGDNKLWEVVDGQQRLTTLKILIKYLLEQMETTLKAEYSIDDFIISYETRPLSNDFLEDINVRFMNSEKDDNIDYHYMSKAYSRISQWFVDQKILQRNEKRYFLDRLLGSTDNKNPVKVIWYEVKDDTDSYDLFTRLNIGKIKLTNSELIKALFLKSSNQYKNSDEKHLNEIAYDWNTLEYKLQNDEFWYFVYNEKEENKYPNRIEYIFDLYSKKDIESEDLHSFFEIEKKFEEIENIESRLKVWQDFKTFFNKIEGWFLDREFYHYIGYLIAVNYSFHEIVKISDKNKDEFLDTLKDRVKDNLNLTNDQFRELRYKKKNKQISRSLLLFNILTILSEIQSNYRFPFNLYKLQSWDIEHIKSKTDKKIIEKKDWKFWIIDIIEFFTAENIFEYNNLEEVVDGNILYAILNDEDSTEISKKLKELLYYYFEKNDFSRIKLEDIFEFFQKYFGEDKDGLDKDLIYNLSLLDQNTNRSYGNAFFPIKRRRIQNNGKFGLFTPICTTNVFMKVYSKKLDNLNHWSETDAQSYMEEMVDMLNPFLK